MTARTALALSAAAIVAGIGATVMQRANHDAAWFLFLSQRVLAGEQLYVDRIELNAPFIVWLGLPVAVLQRAGVPVWHAWTALVALLGFGSMFVAGRLLRRLPDLGVGVWPALAAALFWVPGNGFGQREHVALILLLPYLAATTLRLARRPVSPAFGIVSGIAAAFGAAMKPHLVLIPVVVEAYALARARRLGPESIGIAAGLAACALAVVLFAPEYIAVVREHAPYYKQFGRRNWDGILGPMGVIAVLLTVGLGFLGGRTAEVRRVFGAAAAGGLACAILQLKGWSYHYLPAYGIALVGLAAPVRRPWRWTAWLATAGIVLMGSVTIGHALDREWREAMHATADAMGRYRGEPILVLPFSPEFIFPGALMAGAVPVLPYPDLWPIRALYGRDSVFVPLATAGPFERQVVTRMVDAAMKAEPAAIFVQLGARQDYLAFLARDPRLRVLLECYQRRPDVAWFRVYVRQCTRGRDDDAGAGSSADRP